MKKIRSMDVEFNKDKCIGEFCKSCVLGKSTKNQKLEIPIHPNHNLTIFLHL